MYGYLGKIGLLVPSLNTTMEYDFNRVAPEGVSVHVSRVATEAEGTIEALEEMGRGAKDSAELLAPARPDVAVFGCTSASFVNGAQWTSQLEEKIASVVSCPVVSTASAMIKALERVDAKRVAVLTPYVAATDGRLRSYLTSAGVEVVDLKGMDILDMYSHADIPSDRIAKETLALETSTADAIFIACTQLKTIGILHQLERQLGMPVISAVQSSLWAALEVIGDFPIEGYGSLLAGKAAA